MGVTRHAGGNHSFKPTPYASNDGVMRTRTVTSRADDPGSRQPSGSKTLSQGSDVSMVRTASNSGSMLNGRGSSARVQVSYSATRWLMVPRSMRSPPVPGTAMSCAQKSSARSS